MSMIEIGSDTSTLIDTTSGNNIGNTTSWSIGLGDTLTKPFLDTFVGAFSGCGIPESIGSGTAINSKSDTVLKEVGKSSSSLNPDSVIGM